ncbi:hypothetical protein BDV98DRAFT_659661 [Pterulicium gracile]|uniref:Uncharacterized protein n=1 Tax=Pterulicium gracile TaxID=1884261 RepID=A0A5C3Q1Z6_9AGAR|nr:hypothetical protein BDV98DRAFT_659661 [Pterula gracilis]
MHFLPDDVLSAIFTLLVEEIVDDDTFPHYDDSLDMDWNTFQPWASAAVCQRWRDVISTSNQLWARAQNSYYRRERLERAGVVILFASLRSHADGVLAISDFTNHDLSAFLTNIIPKCKKFKLPGMFVEDLLPNNALKAVYLEDLTLDTESWYPCTAFESAPRLTRLTLHDASHAPGFDRFVPWNRLTSLTMNAGGLHLEEMVLILRSTPRLTFLSLMTTLDPPQAQAQVTTVEFPKLRILELSHCDTSEMVTSGQLLEQMKMPFLPIMNITLKHWCKGPSLTTFLGADEVQTSITSLTIPWPSLQKEDARRLLPLLTFLQFPRLRISSGAEITLRLFTWHSVPLKTARPCPKLIHLHREPADDDDKNQALKFSAWAALRDIPHGRRVPLCGERRRDGERRKIGDRERCSRDGERNRSSERERCERGERREDFRASAYLREGWRFGVGVGFGFGFGFGVGVGVGGGVKGSAARRGGVIEPGKVVTTNKWKAQARKQEKNEYAGIKDHWSAS